MADLYEIPNGPDESALRKARALLSLVKAGKAKVFVVAGVDDQGRLMMLVPDPAVRDAFRALGAMEMAATWLRGVTET